MENKDIELNCFSYFKCGDPGLCTVCPGNSDPPEKILNIFASENEVYTIFSVCPESSNPPEKNILIYLHQKIKFTQFFNYYDI